MQKTKFHVLCLFVMALASVAGADRAFGCEDHAKGKRGALFHDQDNDGVVTKAEALEGAKSWAEKKEAKAKLTPEQAAEKVEKKFSQADQNGDGNLTKDELKTYRETKKQRQSVN